MFKSHAVSHPIRDRLQDRVRMSVHVGPSVVHHKRQKSSNSVDGRHDMVHNSARVEGRTAAGGTRHSVPITQSANPKSANMLHAIGVWSCSTHTRGTDLCRMFHAPSIWAGRRSSMPTTTPAVWPSGIGHGRSCGAFPPTMKTIATMLACCPNLSAWRPASAFIA